MTEEKRNEIKDLVKTLALCAVAIGFVFNMNSKFSKDKTAPKTQITVQTNDSLRTDTLRTAHYMQQKSR